MEMSLGMMFKDSAKAYPRNLEISLNTCPDSNTRSPDYGRCKRAFRALHGRLRLLKNLTLSCSGSDSDQAPLPNTPKNEPSTQAAADRDPPITRGQYVL